MIKKIDNLLKQDDGATAIEYALIASLIAVVIIAALALTGASLTTTYNDIAANM